MIAANDKPLRAAVYLRMSTDTQKDSPDRQRIEIAPFLQRMNYVQVTEFLDHGIGGTETVKREAFQQLIRDAEAGKFDIVVCECIDRFGRLDSVDSGQWTERLKAAGIPLATVREGVFDFNTLDGRIRFNLMTEIGNQWLIGHSHKTLSGRVKAIQNDKVNNGYPPLGYQRVFFDQTGAEVYRAERLGSFRKPPNWTAKSIIQPEEAEIVRMIFREFTTTEISIRQLARELTLKKVQTPRRYDHRWNWGAVEYILTNPIYVGRIEFSRRRTTAKFYSVGKDGRIVQKGNARGRIIVDDACEPIIDRKTFDAAQAKLKGRQRTKQVVRNASAILSGVLRCGHCGGPLYGQCRANPEKGRKWVYQYYVCNQGGRGKCHYFSVPKQAIEKWLWGKIAALMLNDRNKARLREKIQAKLKAKEATTPATAGLKRRVTALDAKIKQGIENLLVVDRSSAPELSSRIEELRRERDGLMDQLTASIPDTRKLGVDAVLEAASGLSGFIKAKHWGKARNAVSTIVESITLYWSMKRIGRRRYTLSKAVITFRNGILPSASFDDVAELQPRDC